MRKEIIEVDKLEYIVTGKQDTEVWITSDGRQFDTEDEAEEHEFFWRVHWKNVNPNMHHSPITLEVQSIDELMRYKEMYLYSYQVITDLTKLNFPNKFVVYDEHIGCDCQPENDQDTDYCYCSDEDTHVTKIVTLDEYKSMIIKHLEAI